MSTDNRYAKELTRELYDQVRELYKKKCKQQQHVCSTSVFEKSTLIRGRVTLRNNFGEIAIYNLHSKQWTM